MPDPDLDAACDMVELTLERLEPRDDRRDELVLGLESLTEANRQHGVGPGEQAFDDESGSSAPVTAARPPKARSSSPSSTRLRPRTNA